MRVVTAVAVAAKRVVTERVCGVRTVINESVTLRSPQLAGALRNDAKGVILPDQEAINGHRRVCPVRTEANGRLRTSAPFLRDASAVTAVCCVLYYTWAGARKVFEMKLFGDRTEILSDDRILTPVSSAEWKK